MLHQQITPKSLREDIYAIVLCGAILQLYDSILDELSYIVILDLYVLCTSMEHRILCDGHATLIVAFQNRRIFDWNSYVL